jgi:hypothetical protein
MPRTTNNTNLGSSPAHIRRLRLGSSSTLVTTRIVSPFYTYPKIAPGRTKPKCSLGNRITQLSGTKEMLVYTFAGLTSISPISEHDKRSSMRTILFVLACTSLSERIVGRNTPVQGSIRIISSHWIILLISVTRAFFTTNNPPSRTQ